MMASKASHTTIKKIATPAIKAPGAGIMCGILTWSLREFLALALENLGLEARAYGNLGLEKLGNGATGFGGLDRGIEFGFVRAGDAGDEIEMALGNAEAVSDFFEADGGGGFQFLRGETGAAELRGKSHGEATGVRGAEQLLGIGANAVLKTRAAEILAC